MTTNTDIVSELYLYKELDELTGLLSRSAFEKRLDKLTDSISCEDTEHAFIFIDIDLFKVVNDIHGHNAGDALICSIAGILKSKTRHEDILARLGGDEFGLIIKECNVNNAEKIATEIKNSIYAYKGKTNTDSYSVSASIGIVMMNKNSNQINDLMRKADIACFTAKSCGRDRVKIYQEDDHNISMHSGDMQWYKRICHALENNSFELYSQPIYPLAVSEMMNNSPVCEILLRMKGEGGELISPSVFMPPANRYGISPKIDKWVIGAVLDFLNEHVEQADQFSMVSVNLSGQSLGDNDVLLFLIERLRTLRVSPSILCFEITETEAIENMNNAINFINKIKLKFGCQFALDDFGSGFSSFSYIKLLPVDIVKIDGSFILDILEEPVSRIMVKALNDIAQVSHKTTIAEWVETKEILDEIQQLGFNYCQGHYLGMPMPIEEFVSLEAIV